MLGEDMLTEGVKVNRSFPILTDAIGQSFVFLTARAQGGVYLTNGINVGPSGAGFVGINLGVAPYFFNENAYFLDFSSAQDWSSQKDIDALNTNYAMVEPIAAGFQFKPSVSAIQNQGNIFIRGDYQKSFAATGNPSGANVYALSDTICRTTSQNGLKTVAIPLQEGVHGCLIPLQDNCKMATRQIRWNDDNANAAYFDYQGAPGAVGQAIRSLGAFAVGGTPSNSIWPIVGNDAYKNWIKEQYTHFSTVVICFTGCQPNTNIGTLELSMHLECTSQDKGLDRAQPSMNITHPLTIPAANVVMRQMPQAIPLAQVQDRTQMRSQGGGLGKFFGPIVGLARDTALNFAKKLIPF